MPESPARKPGDSGVQAARGGYDSFDDVERPTLKFCPTCQRRHPGDFKMCPSDGTALVDADELVGITLSDSYLVVRILGEGGMGRVYEARHTRLESKRFAIKTLHPELAGVPHIVDRFHREALASAAIDSPYVVGAYDVAAMPDGRLYLVSELLEGAELGVYLKERQKLSVPLAVRIARQLCKALTAAHRAGVVHRDLKPANVFLTGDPAAPLAKVLDFGIAKFDDRTGKALTRTGIIMGTPAFMAPEQARGKRVDQRADIYEAGAILFMMLTGRAPFEGNDPGGVLVQVMTGAPPPARSIEPSIPAALEEVVERAMASDPSQRYPDAQAFDTALAPFDTEGETFVDDETSSSTGVPSLRGGATALRRSESIEQQRLEAERARGELGLLGMLSLGTLALALVSALTALARSRRDDGGVSGGAVVVMVMIAAMLLGGPSYALWRWIKSRRWDDGQIVALATATRKPVIAAVAVYGLGTLLARSTELLLLRGAGAAWWGWDVLLLVAAAVSAAVVALVRWLERRPTAVPVAWRPALVVLDRPALLAATLGALLLTIFVGLPLVRGPAAGSQPPSPESAFGAEIRALVAQGEHEQAVDRLALLASAHPNALASDEVQALAVELALAITPPKGDLADRLFGLLSEGMGAAGIDVLYRLHRDKSGGDAAERADALLKDDAVRGRASEALRLAYQLRHTPNCDAVLALLERIETEGDKRALDELDVMASCASTDRCCLGDNERLAATRAALEKRLE
jgi:serine/threonine-protein kinase